MFDWPGGGALRCTPGRGPEGHSHRGGFIIKAQGGSQRWNGWATEATGYRLTLSTRQMKLPASLYRMTFSNQSEPVDCCAIRNRPPRVSLDADQARVASDHRACL